MFAARFVLGGSQPGLSSGRHQSLLQPGDGSDLREPVSEHHPLEELVHEQEHQREEARVVRRVHAQRLPGTARER